MEVEQEIMLHTKLDNLNKRLHCAEARCIVSQAQVYQTKLECHEMCTEVFQLDIVLSVLLWKIQSI